MTIWIHGVSVGEIKSAKPLFEALKKRHPHAFFLITTTTQTGQEEARRSLPGAGEYRRLPFDWPWVAKKWALTYRPQYLFLIETDVWPNFLTHVQKQKGKTILVSAKMSEKSHRRFSFVPFFAKWLFSKLDLILTQNQIHHNRFAPFVSPEKLYIGGPLKFGMKKEEIKNKIPHLQWTSRPILSVVSTHPDEEKLLIEILLPRGYFLIIAPRHPHRFEEVAHLLEEKKIPFVRLSEPPTPHASILLIDTMGELPRCYSQSIATIVGGSFVPGVGGHNILEPVLYGSPVFFGPHMWGQEEFLAIVSKEKVGKQTSLENLPEALTQAPLMTEKAKAFSQQTPQIAENILDQVEKHLG